MVKLEIFNGEKVIFAQFYVSNHYVTITQFFINWTVFLHS